MFQISPNTSEQCFLSSALQYIQPEENKARKEKNSTKQQGVKTKNDKIDSTFYAKANTAQNNLD